MKKYLFGVQALLCAFCTQCGGDGAKAPHLSEKNKSTLEERMLALNKGKHLHVKTESVAPVCPQTGHEESGCQRFFKWLSFESWLVKRWWQQSCVAPREPCAHEVPFAVTDFELGNDFFIPYENAVDGADVDCCKNPNS